MASFPYLGCTVVFYNIDWLDLYGNIMKSQRQLGVVVKLITNTEATVRVWAMMYKAVVWMVLLYGRNSWVVTEVMLNFMEVFHHRVDQRIAGMPYRKVEEEGWERSSVVEALEEAGLCPMKE